MFYSCLRVEIMQTVSAWPAPTRTTISFISGKNYLSCFIYAGTYHAALMRPLDVLFTGAFSCDLSLAACKKINKLTAHPGTNKSFKAADKG